jgi:hypothetical protein
VNRECPSCERGLVSADAYGRTLATLNGMVEAHVVVLTCPDHRDHRIVRQGATRAPLVPNVRADMDVIVLIGLLHWRLGMKRSEIKAFLSSKGIHLSEATISNRALDFLLLFAQLQEMWWIRAPHRRDAQGRRTGHVRAPGGPPRVHP